MDEYTQGRGYDEYAPNEEAKPEGLTVDDIPIEGEAEANMFFPPDKVSYRYTSDVPEGSPTFAANASIDISLYAQTKETKGNPTYLNWATVWTWLKSTYPKACYELMTSCNGDREYACDPYLGYYVGVYLSLDGETFFRRTELSVLDDHNCSRKTLPYVVTTSKGQKYTINPPDDSDIKNAHRRCLVKAVAEATGFGIKAWDKSNAPAPEATAKISPEMFADIRAQLSECSLTEEAILKELARGRFGSFLALDDLTPNAYTAVMGVIFNIRKKKAAKQASAIKALPKADKQEQETSASAAVQQTTEAAKEAERPDVKETEPAKTKQSPTAGKTGSPSTKTGTRTGKTDAKTAPQQSKAKTEEPAAQPEAVKQTAPPPQASAPQAEPAKTPRKVDFNSAFDNLDNIEDEVFELV